MADENSSLVIDCDVYNEGMKLIHDGKDKEALKYFTKKLRKDEVEWKDREHLCYQLAHYYLFGIFDPYYNGYPSKMSRIGTTVKDLEKGLEYLSESNYKCRGILYAMPTYPSYNQKEAIRAVLNKDEVGKDFQNAVIYMAFFSGKVCKVNPMEMWIEDMMNNSNEQICDEHIRRIAWYSSLYPYIFSSSVKYVSMPVDVNKGAESNVAEWIAAEEVVKDWRRPAAVLLRRQSAQLLTELRAGDKHQTIIDIQAGSTFLGREQGA